MKNAIEDAVRNVYTALQKKHAEFCACPRCQDDVMALALNHTKPRYVAGDPPLGAAVTSAQLAGDQARAQLTVIVFDAMRRVAAHPRHEVRS